MKMIEKNSKQILLIKFKEMHECDQEKNGRSTKNQLELELKKYI